MAEEPSKADFSLADGHGYAMNSKHLSACRLNLQFYLWKDALGFDIHPSIPPYLPSIADVAAGTGAWLIDLSRILPKSTRLDGFDNDLDQAPHATWLPRNVKIRHWDIFSELPDDLVGKYDYVHVRLLVLVLESGDPGPILKKLWRMLKPGGYLQWDELDCVNMCVKKVRPEVEAPALEKLLEMSRSNGRHDWTFKLPEFMEKEGFLEVEMENFGDEDRMVRAFNEQHLLTMEEFAASLVKLGKQEAAEEFYRVIGESYQESTRGAALCIPRIVCVGRKPE